MKLCPSHQSHQPSRFLLRVTLSLVRQFFVVQGDLEGAIKVVIMIVGKMAEDRGLSKYQASGGAGVSPTAPFRGTHS